MKTEKLNTVVYPFQVCYVTENDDGKTVCTSTATIDAENIIDAYAAAAEMTGDAAANNYRIYPLAITGDADSIYRLAEYARKRDLKWRIANDAAANSAFHETQDDAADALQNAVLAIVATLAENPAADMLTVYRAASALLKSERAKQYRISEHEYNPEWTFHNPFIENRARATFPKLAKLIERATVAADFTERQAEFLELYGKGITAAVLMDRLNISRNAYYQTLYSALYKTLAKAVEIDGDSVPTFTRYGIDVNDVKNALATFAKRARIKTK